MNTIFTLSLVLCVGVSNVVYSVDSASHVCIKAKNVQDRIAGALYGAAIGDAQGRVTEFIATQEILDKRYPGGIHSFDNLKSSDWAWRDNQGVVQLVPAPAGEKLFVPYTDDTYMALIVWEVMLEARKNNWDVNTTMDRLARRFVTDWLENPDATSGIRAIGNTCRIGAQALRAKIQAGDTTVANWWNVADKNSKGCGSVMRAWPIGIVFYDDLKKVEEFAVAQSKLSHGHPGALAASAAMAVGMAYAMQGEKPHNVAHCMLNTAKKYDKNTSAKMIDAIGMLLGAYKDESFLGFGRPFDIVAMRSDSLQLQDDIRDMYKKYPGWAGDDAIAAVVATFALSTHEGILDICVDAQRALFLGVHTPGADSDSIASMAGALAGAYTGMAGFNVGDVACVENSEKLRELARQTGYLFK